MHPTQDGLTALHSQRTAYCFISDRYDLFPGSYGVVRLTIPYAEMQKKIEEPKKETPVPKEIRNKKMVALTYDDGPTPRQPMPFWMFWRNMTHGQPSLILAVWWKNIPMW